MQSEQNLSAYLRTRRRARDPPRRSFGDLLRTVFGGEVPRGPPRVRKGRNLQKFSPTVLPNPKAQPQRSLSSSSKPTPGPIYYKPLEEEDVRVNGRVVRVIDARGQPENNPNKQRNKSGERAKASSAAVLKVERRIETTIYL